MGKAAWICFECREAVRRDTWHRGEVLCPRCNAQMAYLGYKIPVPPKRDVKRWRELRDQLIASRQARQAELFQAEGRRRQELELEIARMELMPSNPGRAKHIRNLKKQLDGS